MRAGGGIGFAGGPVAFAPPVQGRGGKPSRRRGPETAPRRDSNRGRRAGKTGARGLAVSSLSRPDCEPGFRPAGQGRALTAPRPPPNCPLGSSRALAARVRPRLARPRRAGNRVRPLRTCAPRPSGPTRGTALRASIVFGFPPGRPPTAWRPGLASPIWGARNGFGKRCTARSRPAARMKARHAGTGRRRQEGLRDRERPTGQGVDAQGARDQRPRTRAFRPLR